MKISPYRLRLVLIVLLVPLSQSCGNDPEELGKPNKGGPSVDVKASVMQQTPAEAAAASLSALPVSQRAAFEKLAIERDLADRVSFFFLSPKSTYQSRNVLLGGPMNYLTADRDTYVRLKPVVTNIKQIRSSEMEVQMLPRDEASYYDPETEGNDSFVAEGTKVFFKKFDTESNAAIYEGTNQDNQTKVQIHISARKVVVQAKTLPEAKTEYDMITEAFRLSFSKKERADILKSQQELDVRFPY